jgi:photosystem II stability/assembly factor-like uncharacterized protein
MHGYLLGYGPNLKRTADGGVTWTNLTVPGSVDPNGFWFTDFQHGFLLGPAHLYVTADAGNTWSSAYSGSYMSFVSIFFLGQDLGFVAGSQYNSSDFMLKTTDGGSTWQKKENIGTGNLGRLFFTDAMNGYMISRQFRLLKTTNGGESWTGNPLYLTDNLVNATFFTSPDTGYIAGTNGMIMKTGNGGVITSVKNADEKAGISLFPNPSSGRFFLKSNQEVDHLSVQVYTAMGKMVSSRTYQNPHFPVSADLSAFPPGIYVVVANSEKFMVVKKIIVIVH